MMDNSAFEIQQALELLKTGRKAEAQTLLLPLIKQNPDNAEAWYLLAFTFTEPHKRRDSFRQVLRIDPYNQAAQKQLDKMDAAARPATPEASFRATQSQPYPVSRPQAAPAGKPAPVTTSKKPARKKLVIPLELILAAAGLLVLVIAGAVYLGIGMNRSKTVDALFSERKCNEVVQHASFTNLFPRAIFSSLFSVYHQVDECQAKLALEQAIGAQDWAAAYAVIGNYLSNYPGGVFATEMHAQVGDILLSWAKELVAKNDYDLAIQKLKSFQTVYPTSPAAPQALKAMLDDYLLWANHVFEQKSFEAAERYLKIVNSHEQASAEQVAQANRNLAAVYLQWGQSEVENGSLEQGLQHYDQAQQLDPSLTDYDRIKTQAKLVHANAQAKKGDFDKALAEIKEISDAAQSEGSKADAAEAQAKVLVDYAHSTASQAQAQMSTAAANTCKNILPELPIFGLDADTNRFAFVAPFNLEAPQDWLATMPAELHNVLCIEEEQATIQSCNYTGGHVLQRKRFTWSLTLYNILSGEKLKTTKIQGSAPPSCAQWETFYSGSNKKDIYGNRPTMQQITDWLTKIKITP